VYEKSRQTCSFSKDQPLITGPISGGVDPLQQKEIGGLYYNMCVQMAYTSYFP